MAGTSGTEQPQSSFQFTLADAICVARALLTASSKIHARIDKQSKNDADSGGQSHQQDEDPESGILVSSACASAAEKIINAVRSEGEIHDSMIYEGIPRPGSLGGEGGSVMMEMEDSIMEGVRIRREPAEVGEWGTTVTETGGGSGGGKGGVSTSASPARNTERAKKKVAFPVQENFQPVVPVANVLMHIFTHKDAIRSALYLKQMASEIQSTVTHRDKGKVPLRYAVGSAHGAQQQQHEQEGSTCTTSHGPAACLIVYEKIQKTAGKQVASALQAGSDRLLQAVSVETTKKSRGGETAMRPGETVGVGFGLAGGAPLQSGGPAPPPGIPTTYTATAGQDITFTPDWIMQQPWAMQEPLAASPTRAVGPAIQPTESEIAAAEAEERATEDLILSNLKAYAAHFKSAEAVAHPEMRNLPLTRTGVPSGTDIHGLKIPRKSSGSKAMGSFGSYVNAVALRRGISPDELERTVPERFTTSEEDLLKLLSYDAVRKQKREQFLRQQMQQQGQVGGEGSFGKEEGRKSVATLAQRAADRGTPTLFLKMPPSATNNDENLANSAPQGYRVLSLSDFDPNDPNNTNVDVATSFGYSVLGLGFVFMAMSALIFWKMTLRREPEKRLFHYITTTNAVIAALCYYYMWASDGLIVFDVTGYGRQVFFARYLDWALTTPLLLVKHCFLAELPIDKITWLTLMDMLMILVGLLGAVEPNPDARWVWFGCGVAFFLPICYNLVGSSVTVPFGQRDGGFRNVERTGIMERVGWVQIVGDEKAEDGCEGRLKSHAEGGVLSSVHETTSLLAGGSKSVDSAFMVKGFSTCTAVVWASYPVVWALSQGMHYISPDLEIAVYALLDLLSKTLFGGYLLWKLR
ncbi:hypothetical protein HK102_006938 [Quaeritorhiza haematococci]|nr:hypothetical protein HK102_006938 [Quaeritorhiza haematococci]